MLLKPQLVNYPIEDLMLQHHLISMVLFFIVTAIFFFFIIFLYNILLISYRNKIMNYFKNKYILIYLNFQFKISVNERSETENKTCTIRNNTNNACQNVRLQTIIFYV